MESSNKSVLARELGVSRGSLYYKPLKPDKDWQLKCLIEETLRNHSSYGSRRIFSVSKHTEDEVENGRKPRISRSSTPIFF